METKEAKGQSVKERILKYIKIGKRPDLLGFDESDINYITTLLQPVQTPKRVGLLRKRTVFFDVYPPVVYSPDGDVYVQSKVHAQQIGGGGVEEVEIRAAARLIRSGDGVKKEIKVYVKGGLKRDGIIPKRKWRRASILENNLRKDIEEEKVTIVGMGRAIKIRE